MFADGDEMRLSGSLHKPYSSKIIVNYLEHIQVAYPSVDRAALLREAELDLSALHDEGGWLSQEEVRRFYHAGVRATGSPNLAREAGRYLLRARALGPVAGHILGVTNALSLYQLLPVAAHPIALNVDYAVTTLSERECVVDVTVRSGFSDELFQCENRLGVLEGLPTVLGQAPAVVAHTSCLHRGDSRCSYHIYLLKTPELTWNTASAGLGVMAGLTAISALLVGPLGLWGSAALGLSALLAAHLGAHQRQRRFIAVMERQRQLGDDVRALYRHLTVQDEIMRRIGEIGALGEEDTPQAILNAVSAAPAVRGAVLVGVWERKPSLWAIGEGAALVAGAGLVEGILTGPVDARDLEQVYLRTRITEEGGFVTAPLSGGVDPIGWIGVILGERAPTERDASAVRALGLHIGLHWERARAAREAKRVHAMSARVLDLSPDWIVGVDATDRIVYRNAAALAALPDDTLPFADVSGIGVSAAALVEAPRANETTRWHAITLEGRGPSSAHTLVTGVSLDAERAFALEQQIRDESRVRAQKMEALGALAGGISHDFNNILAGISVNTELLLSQTSSSSESAELLREILESVSRASGLTRQLLSFSRGQPLQTVRVDLHAQIRQITRLFARMSPQVRVELDLEERASGLFADAQMLDQVLLNLCINAGQAMPDGGTLWVRTRREGATVRLTVEDTGAGMDDDVRARIFEPFFTTRGDRGGTGLGLATARSIVLRHGGEISVASEPGKGTVFSILLPQQPDASSAAAPGALRPARRSARVLLVDDDPLVLRSSARLMHHLGFEVGAFEGGREGLEWAELNPVEIAVIDMVMPSMSGPELFGHLRAMWPKLPVLLASGYSPEGSVETLLTQPLTAFLQKPFDRRGLASAIDALLQHTDR